MIDTYASIIAYENGPSWSPLRTTGILVTRGSREWITLLWLAKLQFFWTTTRSACDDIGIHSLSGAHHITKVLATLAPPPSVVEMRVPSHNNNKVDETPRIAAMSTKRRRTVPVPQVVNSLSQ